MCLSVPEYLRLKFLPYSGQSPPAGISRQSNFTLKLLWRPRERTPAAKAQAQFICAIKRRSGRGLKINRV
jgi:hypothetical protein